MLADKKDSCTCEIIDWIYFLKHIFQHKYIKNNSIFCFCYVHCKLASIYTYARHHIDESRVTQSIRCHFDLWDLVGLFSEWQDNNVCIKLGTCNIQNDLLICSRTSDINNPLCIKFHFTKFIIDWFFMTLVFLVICLVILLTVSVC